MADFRVVGVLGTQGAGKSSLLNALLYDTPSGQLASHTAAVPAAGVPPFAVCGRGPARSSEPRAARQQSPSTDCGHCTSRLDLRVHPGDRTLLLDTPPLWSASWVAELAAGSEPPLLHSAGAGAGSTLVARAAVDARSRGLASLPVEGVAELLSLQLGALMLAVCHVVVLVVDAVDEPRLWEYLQVIDLVAHCLPDVASAAAASAASTAAAVAPSATPFPGAAFPVGAARRVAELVVVVSGVDGDVLTARRLRPHRELLRMALQSTRLLSAGPEGAIIDVVRYLGSEGTAAAKASAGHLLAASTAAARSPVSAAPAGAAPAAGGGGRQDEEAPHGARGGGDAGRHAEPAGPEVEGDCGPPPGGFSGSGGEGEGQGGSGRGYAVKRGQAEAKARSLQRQQQLPQEGERAAGGGEAAWGGGEGELHFWALPRHWQGSVSVPGSGPPLTTLQPADAALPSHPAAAALLAPLRSALLALPRRQLALPPPPQQHPQLAVPPSQQTGPGQAPAPPLSEREWLRGVERLWSCELQQCGPLERFYLARQRTVFAGGGGWPLGNR